MNLCKKVYMLLYNGAQDVVTLLIPYFRRVIRFLALPYAYIFLVNWKECTSSRIQVAKDFIYIFFVLKDFPDYYSQFRLWEKKKSEWCYYYGSIYNPFQRARLRKEVQKKEYEILFEDKYVCNQLCLSANLPLPKFLGYVEKDIDFKMKVKAIFDEGSADVIYIKSSRGMGGRHIYQGYKVADKIMICDGKNEVKLEDFILKCPSVLQACVKQHPSLQAIAKSVNTIRTETLLTCDNDVIVLGAFMRFGIHNSIVDNQSVGGLSIGVDIETGRLYDYAMNGRGEKYFKHPASGFEFSGFKIPFWKEVIELSKQIQRFFSFYKLLGPDIAITSNGPVIIEINSNPDHAGLEMDYGPTFKSKKVWTEFKRYDLLINKASKAIW